MSVVVTAPSAVTTLTKPRSRVTYARSPCTATARGSRPSETRRCSVSFASRPRASDSRPSSRRASRPSHRPPSRAAPTASSRAPTREACLRVTGEHRDGARVWQGGGETAIAEHEEVARAIAELRRADDRLRLVVDLHDRLLVLVGDERVDTPSKRARTSALLARCRARASATAGRVAGGAGATTGGGGAASFFEWQPVKRTSPAETKHGRATHHPTLRASRRKCD